MKTTTTIGLLTGLFASAVPVVHAVNDEAIAHAGKCMTCHGGSDEWGGHNHARKASVDGCRRLRYGKAGSGLLNVCWYAWQND